MLFGSIFSHCEKVSRLMSVESLMPTVGGIGECLTAQSSLDQSASELIEFLDQRDNDNSQRFSAKGVLYYSSLNSRGA